METNITKTSEGKMQQLLLVLFRCGSCAKGVKQGSRNIQSNHWSYRSHLWFKSSRPTVDQYWGKFEV